MGLFYARALPFSFTAGMHQYFQKVSRDSAGVSSHAVELNWNEVCRSIGQIDPLRAGALCSGTFNISQYSYLSGLDGESSEVQAKRSKLKKKRIAEKTKRRTRKGSGTSTRTSDQKDHLNLIMCVGW